MPPAYPLAHGIEGGGQGTKVYVRGNPATRGEDAPKGFLQVLSKSGAKTGSDFTRLDLADAIASPDNPLAKGFAARGEKAASTDEDRVRRPRGSGQR